MNDLLPSPGIAVPSSAMVDAPVHASTPPMSHTTNATPGEGTLVSMDPGDVKIPLPITILITIAKASAVPRVLENEDPGTSASVAVALSWEEGMGPLSGS